MRLLISISLFLIGASLCAAADQPAAPWPPPAGVLRIIIDTEAGAEIDDQYALSLALGSPGRIDPQAVQWERVEAPAVDYDLRYDFSKSMGKIVRIYYVDRNLAFGDLERALRTLLTSR